MKNPSKNKLVTVIILIATFALAGVAIFTAVRLYQLRQEAVAPTAPTSKPKAQEAPTACQALAFNLTTTTPSPTPSGSPSSTPTPTPTPNPSGNPNSCGGTCGSNTNCESGLYCYQGLCRNPDCPSDTDCVCATSTATPTRTATPTPTATQAELPNAGISYPTIIGTGLGIFLLIGSLLLAL